LNEQGKQKWQKGQKRGKKALFASLALFAFFASPTDLQKNEPSKKLWRAVLSSVIAVQPAIAKAMAL
jgi:hypothetical protein